MCTAIEMRRDEMVAVVMIDVIPRVFLLGPSLCVFLTFSV